MQINISIKYSIILINCENSALEAEALYKREKAFITAYFVKIPNIRFTLCPIAKLFHIYKKLK